MLAVDDEFAGEMQRFIYASHPDWVVGSVLSSCMIYKRSRIGGALFVLRSSGLVFLAEMIRMKLLRGMLDRRRRFFPSQLAKANHTPVFITADINAPASIEKLRSWQPDLVISTNFSHYIGKTVRESVARHGCWNLHKSLLPKYRGMAPVFHALLEGEKCVGATLHVVAKGFDTGAIIAQAEVPVTRQDTVYSLNRKTSEAGGRLMAKTLERGDLSALKPTSQPEGNWRNYTYPTAAEVAAFRGKGLRFYRPSKVDAEPGSSASMNSWDARIS